MPRKAGRCEVVLVEYLGVAEPAWIGFMCPWGPTEVYDIGRVINGLKQFLLSLYHSQSIA